MAYCPANPGWERQRKSEKKNYRSDCFLHEPKQRIEKKKSKKIQKIKKHHNRFFSSQNRLGKVEKESK